MPTATPDHSTLRTTSGPAVADHGEPLLCCDELSIEHLDGTTECTDAHCEVPHRLHRFTASCGEVPGPCGCPAAGPAEHQPAA